MASKTNTWGASLLPIKRVGATSINPVGSGSLRPRRPTESPAAVVPQSQESAAALEERTYSKELGSLVRSVIKSNKFQSPLLPAVAARLRSIVDDLDATVADVEAAISHDPCLVARVLCLANSAFYGRGSPVYSLRVAISRLGILQARELVFQVVTMTPVFEVSPYSDFLRRSVETGVASALLCKEICRLRGAPPEVAYLSGLMRDVGEVAIVKIVADQPRAFSDPLPSLEKLAPALQDHHELVGALVCRQWKLNETVVEAVAAHHRPLGATDPHKLAGIVALSDRLLAYAGIGCNPEPWAPDDYPLLAHLSLSKEASHQLMTYAASLAQNRPAWSIA